MSKETISIYFDAPKDFVDTSIRPLNGIVGLYFIFSKSITIQYPFDSSSLLYIGMSEKKTNSIGRRLLGHYDGTSMNAGLVNYRKRNKLLFTYLNFELLRERWRLSIEQLESYFILDFVKHFGVYPICNNKSGYDILSETVTTNIGVDWNYFK